MRLAMWVFHMFGGVFFLVIFSPYWQFEVYRPPFVCATSLLHPDGVTLNPPRGFSNEIIPSLVICEFF